MIPREIMRNPHLRTGFSDSFIENLSRLMKVGFFKQKLKNGDLKKAAKTEVIVEPKMKYASKK